MEKEMKVEFELENIKSSKVGSIIILEPKSDGFQGLLNIEENIELLEWFDFVGQDQSVKGILFIGDEYCFGDYAYAKHLKSLTGEDILPEEPRIVKKIVDHKSRSIQINMLNSFIRKIVELPKMTFVALSHCVVSPFWGLSLAADYRIANPNLLVHLNSKEYGLHPSGGVPFFMKKQLGLSKTQEILYGEKILDAQTLKNLGLINKLTSANNYRDDAISITNNILESTNLEYFYYTKQLVNFRLLKEFESYTDIESKMEFH